ncbi:MAG: hypothetical protein JWN25_3305, partial [Verrucomicrobiales bacterium]|nr:hypothetical protein [Verrucomicrobiales bacterium]
FAFIGERADKNGLLEWHRYSQELSGLLHKDKVMLVVKYRLLLKKNPGNATYLYLMGRVAESSQESQMLFEQAAAADPNSPYPRIALAFNALSDGDFQKALSECGKAKTSSKTLNRKLEAMALDAALGLRQFDRVEEIAAARLAKSKSDLAAEGMLLESRILKGDAPGADSQFASFAKVLKSQIGATADDYIAAEQNQILYMKGDFATLLYRLKGSRNPFLFFATLERGSPELAEKLMPQDASLGYYQLLQSMAYRKSGNEEAAGKWEKKAMETIASADPGNRAADLLSLGRAPVDGEIQAFRAPLNTKRIVLGALCLKYPAKQKEYGPLLDKLNVHLDFPHHFLSRIAAGK